MSVICKWLNESNIEDLLVEACLITHHPVVQALCGGHYDRATSLYKLSYKAMLRILISHGKKNNLLPRTHLDDLLNSIGNTGLNSERHFHAFQSILFDEDLSEAIIIIFNNATFSADYKSTYWPNIMPIDKRNPNVSFHNYIEEVEKMISNHTSLRKTRKRELKFQSKPWITSVV